MTAKKKNRYKRVDFVCHLAPSPQSPYWSIVKYYQSLDKEKSRQMVLQALTTFWLPEPRQSEEENSNQEPQREGVKDAIYCLQQQINWLQSQFPLTEANKEEIQFLDYKSRKETHFSFRFQSRASESSESMQQLLNSHEKVTLEQKILWSSLAYWGAIADRELGLLDEEELNQSAANCIIRLRQHIEYLEDYFQLKEVPTAPVMTLPTGWEVFATSNGKGSTEAVAGASEEEEEKDVSQTELDPEIQRLLRGDPESDKFMTEMFASL